MAHGSYEALVADPGVDVVYVATPHNFHVVHALLAIEAGKHVLVEKPVGLDADEARAIGDAAVRAGVFCMEAMWTLFLPKFDVVRQVLEEGALGRVVAAHADMGERFDEPHRIMRPELAGGPLLDLGTYAVTFATWTLGAPDTVTAVATPALARAAGAEQGHHLAGPQGHVDAGQHLGVAEGAAHRARLDHQPAGHATTSPLRQTRARFSASRIATSEIRPRAA